jgi:hypothetical protein
MGLRADIEADLAETLEDQNDFALPVVLISPDGVVYPAVYGQVLYNSIREQMPLTENSNGVMVIDHSPVAVVRRSSLTRVPLSDENWAVRIPISPLDGAPLVTFVLDRPSEDGDSIGFIRLYLRKVEQV